MLDEADRMLGTGFIDDIETLLSSPGMPSKENRCTLMFSATFPADIQRLARQILKVDYLFVAVGKVGAACRNVEQRFIEVEESEKSTKLIKILQETGDQRTIVCVNTKRKAKLIALALRQTKVPSDVIHGDREQREKETALNDFKNGKYAVLVATSVAARGLDIANGCVINLDMPSNISEYVHRIGRTERSGNVGRAITFFS